MVLLRVQGEAVAVAAARLDVHAAVDRVPEPPHVRRGFQHGVGGHIAVPLIGDGRFIHGRFQGCGVADWQHPPVGGEGRVMD